MSGQQPGAPSPMVALLRGFYPYAIAILIAFVMYKVMPVGAEKIDLGILQINSFFTKVTGAIGIAIIMAVSLNIVNGYTGQFSLGHAGFMAIGAYTSAWITHYGSIHFFGNANAMEGLFTKGSALFVASLLAAGLVSALFGYLVGLPSLRLRGDYLAIVTLGFGEILRALLNQTQPVLDEFDIEEATRGEIFTGLGGALGFSGVPKYSNLFWVWSVAIITVIICYRLKQSIHGKAFLSIRENEIAAEAMGVPTTHYKVAAFAIAAFFAGVGGALFAHTLGNIVSPNEMNYQRSIDFVIMVVLGGMGSISGSVIAAVALTILPESLREFSEYRMIVYAILLIVFMIVRPDGIFGIREFWEVKWIRRLFRRTPKETHAP
ncbi:branched-chain amino acid ABC transporter permease [Candidatus Sumerlaeota bacterium]|nr:branched-chain amino acid ABC transporter permease [Candidatus Sumerlaeota bacterium]